MAVLKLEEKTAKRLIIGVSFAVTALVAILSYLATKRDTSAIDVSFIPPFHAFLNACVTVALCLGVYFVKKKKVKQHQYAMLSALVLSAMFLISYVFYHSIAPSTSYPKDVGFIRYIYLSILLTHVVLSAVILPFILFTFYYSLSGKIEKHRKLAKIVFPLWLYVAVSGVVVYFMIAPYY
ncbi:MAG: DUF420 domain-containing protein [Chitinophagales bacterium]